MNRVNPQPTYLRPVEYRIDIGLVLPTRWSEGGRNLWMLHVEMGII